MINSTIAPTLFRRAPHFTCGVRRKSKARTLKKAVKINFRLAKANPRIAVMFPQISNSSYVEPNFSKVVACWLMIINY